MTNNFNIKNEIFSEEFFRTSIMVATLSLIGIAVFVLS